MKSTFIGRENNDVTFKMEFEAEEFDNAIQKAYQASKGKFAVDGFRRGKAPRKLIEAKFGADVFYEDAINDLFSQSYPQALDTLEVNPVDRPNAEFSKVEAGNGFDITIKVTVMPEIEVKDYKGVKVKKIDATITEEDVAKDLEALQKRNARMVLVERPSKEGDTVLIDYQGFVGDQQFEGGTAERQPLTLGSGSFIPGFEEQLVGVSAGEEKDVKVTFPEEYHAQELAGKEAVFKCKVHEIKEEELAELNDEFAKDVSEFDTLEELKKDTREKLEKAASEKAEYEMKNAVLEKIYEANDVDIPEIMVQDQIGEMLQELAQQLKYQGLELQNYLEYIQKDLKEFREDLRPDAYKKVKTKLLVEAVAKAEQMDVSDEEMDQELAKMAEMYKMEVDQLREAMGVEGILYLKKDVENKKALDFVFENAVFE